MADSGVYRVTEVIGLSPDGWAEAAANAVATAGRPSATCAWPRWCART